MRTSARLSHALFALASIAVVIPGLSGCGDIGMVRVEVAFTDPGNDAAKQMVLDELELRTRALLFVVRQVPEGRSGCDDLWSAQPTGLAENRSLIEYPNRNDVLAAPVRLTEYPALTLLVYAYPSMDVTATQAIAGGCIQTPISPDVTSDVLVTMEPAP